MLMPNTVMDWSIWELIKIFAVGMFFDVVSFSNFIIPFIIVLIILPNRFYNSVFNRYFTYAIYFITYAIIIYGGFAEYFFWEEFGVRFNFISVDYLVYTNEVIDNITESYPIPLLITIIIISTSLIMFFLIKKSYLKISLQNENSLKFRISTGLGILLLPVIFFFIVNLSFSEISTNKFHNELSKNGIYSIFSAFRNNQLDYNDFYKKQDINESFKILRKQLLTPNSKYVSDNIQDITRIVEKDSTSEKRYNIMLITVESLSAEYMEYYGMSKGIPVTPYLDSLLKHSIHFDNFYATGNRTVRGLEALTLSMPPTPGRSTIKRPNNENMFSIGFIFKDKGYDNKFIYGGYGYFDNMNYFFENNGFQVIDRGLLEEGEETFGNAWGVCDEDLFNRALKECDKSYKSKKPFFNLIMTVSNHRPFTYPEGKIDLPSLHSGRNGGVKYTDYAINEFIKKCKTKPWFDNTVFVIVSDHCGGSAGRAELPVREYHIPLIIYNPKLFEPKIIHTQASQIDVAPTILGILNWTYKSKFFGKDIFKMHKNSQRALIANYQKLGYLCGDKLMILSPQEKVTFYKYDKPTENLEKIKLSEEIVKQTVAYYQVAAYMYKNKLNKK